MKPCLVCGEPSSASRCETHQRSLTKERNDRATRHTDRGRWKRLSLRLRRLQDWCDWCGTKDSLSVDHIIPVHERPDLEYNLANLRILCRSCNSRRGTRVTDDERTEVARRLAARPGETPRPGPTSQARVAALPVENENDSQLEAT